MQLHYMNYPYKGKEKRMAYWVLGQPDSERTVVCVHGLLRHSRDFDELAQALQAHCRVICPDLPGRGLSDPLDDASDYHPEFYVELMLGLFDATEAPEVDWVGTSLGGLIGMAIASGNGSLIRRLVLNDIGPELPQAALERIASYIEAPDFSSLDEVEQFLRQTYLSFRGLNHQQWQRLARYGSRLNEAGRFELHYDPKIADNTRASSTQTIELWPLWEAITQPCMLVWGQASDLLTASIVSRMQEYRPDLVRLELAGIGHAPGLMCNDEIEPVVEFILGDHLDGASD